MKLTKSLIMGVVTLTALTACNNDEYGGADRVGNKLTVFAGINELKTRVSDTGTEWTAKDAIGVSDDLTSQPNLNIRYEATNTQGEFDSSTGIFILGSGETTYTAYYPYKGTEGTSAGIINFKISDAGGVYLGNDSTDFMFAQATTKREDAKVNFQFDHKMSKLRLNITDGSNTVAAGTDISYTLKGVVTDGTFDTSTGSVTTGTTIGNVQVSAKLGTTSSVILLPTATGTETSAINILVKVGDKGYQGTITPALVVSQEYTYTIDISKAGQGNYLAISSPTISGWTPNDGGEVDMAEVINYNSNGLQVGDFICKDGTLIDKDYELTPQLKAKIEAVVFYVGNAQPSVLNPEKYTSDQDILKKEAPNCTNGLAIAINNAQEDPDRLASAKYNYSTWFTTFANVSSFIGDNLNLTSASTTMMGYNNTRLIETAVKDVNDADQTGAANLMTLLANYRSSKAVEGSSYWYLPSYAEWTAVQSNYATVATSVQKAGGSLPQYNDFATEASGAFYWSSDLRGSNYAWVSPLAETTAEKLYVNSASGGTKGYFRFAIAF